MGRPVGGGKEENGTELAFGDEPLGEEWRWQHQWLRPSQEHVRTWWLRNKKLSAGSLAAKSGLLRLSREAHNDAKRLRSQVPCFSLASDLP